MGLALRDSSGHRRAFGLAISLAVKICLSTGVIRNTRPNQVDTFFRRQLAGTRQRQQTREGNNPRHRAPTQKIQLVLRTTSYLIEVKMY